VSLHFARPEAVPPRARRRCPGRSASARATMRATMKPSPSVPHLRPRGREVGMAKPGMVAAKAKARRLPGCWPGGASRQSHRQGARRRRRGATSAAASSRRSFRGCMSRTQRRGSRRRTSSSSSRRTSGRGFGVQSFIFVRPSTKTRDEARGHPHLRWSPRPHARVTWQPRRLMQA